MPLYSATLRQFSRLLPLLPVVTGLLCCWWLVGSIVPLWLPASPAARVLAQPQPQAEAGSVAAQSWFGAASSGALPQAALAMTLHGVMGGGQGSRQDFAVLQENGRVLALRPGDRSPGGWQLLRVEGQAVVLRGPEGREQRLALQRLPAANPVPANAVPVPSPGQPIPDGGALQPLPVLSATGETGLGHADPGRLDAKRGQP